MGWALLPFTMLTTFHIKIFASAVIFFFTYLPTQSQHQLYPFLRCPQFQPPVHFTSHFCQDCFHHLTLQCHALLLFFLRCHSGPSVVPCIYYHILYIYSALEPSFILYQLSYFGASLCVPSQYLRCILLRYNCLVPHSSLASQFRFPFPRGALLIHSTDVHHAPLIHVKRNGRNGGLCIRSMMCGFGVSCFFL